MLLELAAKCEAATGPDRELDCAISLALVEPPEGCKAVASKLSSQAGLLLDRLGRLHGTVDYQPFTASLDAAMTLVPEGLCVLLSSINPEEEEVDGRWHALVGDPESSGDDVPSGATAALALCAAALRARSTNPNTERQSL